MTRSAVPLQIEGFHTYLTEAGAELLQERSDLADAIARATLVEQAADGKNPYQYIGYGMRAEVNTLPGYAELCIKTSTPKTGRESYFRGGRQVTPENLIVQTRFMDRLRGHLQTSYHKTGVTTPEYYMAARSHDGATNIAVMQRIPDSFITLSRYAAANGAETSDPLPARIHGRIKEALGHSVLRLGVDDLGNGSIDTGNILINSVMPDYEPIYLIDLPARRIALARVAMMLSRD